MTQRNRTYLKTKWINDYIPSEIDFSDLFDSFINRLDDSTFFIEPAQVVSHEDEYGVESTLGISLKYAREDHSHGTPPEPTLENISGNLPLEKIDVTQATENSSLIFKDGTLEFRDIIVDFSNLTGNPLLNVSLTDSFLENSLIGTVVPYLEDGKIPSTFLSSLFITDVFQIATLTDVSTLTDAKRGDFAVCSDVSKTYILSNDDYENVVNWIEIKFPGVDDQALLPSLVGSDGKVLFGGPEAIWKKIEISDVNNLQSVLDSKESSLPEINSGNINHVLTSLGTERVWRSSISRYDIDPKSIVTANGPGVFLEKTSNQVKFKNPNLVEIISASIYFSDLEITGLGFCEIDYSEISTINLSWGYEHLFCPMIQVFTDLPGNRTLNASIAGNFDINSYVIQISNLIPNRGCWVHIQF